MSDSDDLDIDGDEGGDSGASKKRGGGGLGNLLPTILKFAAIGLGALIFIVTVSVITYNIMSKGGKSQTVITDPLSPYIGIRPDYAKYDGLGSMTVRTRDGDGSSITVEMIIAYKLDDQAATSELISRRYELRDFMRQFFSSKTVEELKPEREAELKTAIKEALNTRFLDTAKAFDIYFDRFDLNEG